MSRYTEGDQECVSYEPDYDRDSDRAVQNFIDGGPPDATVIIREACWMCHGSAWIATLPCFNCAGKGTLRTER